MPPDHRDRPPRERADIRSELLAYSRANGYLAGHFADARCVQCAGTTFRVALDDAAGAATRTCAACESFHAIGDSDDYLAEAALEACACPCGAEVFEVCVGLALYADGDDVRWLYLGCRCVECGLAACYGDWKNEFTNYRALLARV